MAQHFPFYFNDKDKFYVISMLVKLVHLDLQNKIVVWNKNHLKNSISNLTIFFFGNEHVKGFAETNIQTNLINIYKLLNKYGLTSLKT